MVGRRLPKEIMKKQPKGLERKNRPKFNWTDMIQSMKIKKLKR